jgi:ApaG protein
VIGLQPLIKPRSRFIYTSFCQLMTPQGTMEGYYEVQDLDEKRFSVEIPKFILSSPSEISATFRSRLH